MNELIGRVFRFQQDVFPAQAALYDRLATHGQSPKALMISCADSRVVPEHIMCADPGDLFVCRNAGNMVPPFAAQQDGVTATVEYAVAVLGVRDIIVCGHADCGAMKGLAGDPAKLDALPDVAAWLRHGAAARAVVDTRHPAAEGDDRVRAVSLENIILQLAHLGTHPAVAAALARGELTLHGWFFDIRGGVVLALDGDAGRFSPIVEGEKLPVAWTAGPRRAAEPAVRELAA